MLSMVAPVASACSSCLAQPLDEGYGFFFWEKNFVKNLSALYLVHLSDPHYGQ